MSLNCTFCQNPGIARSGSLEAVRLLYCRYSFMNVISSRLWFVCFERLRACEESTIMTIINGLFIVLTSNSHGGEQLIIGWNFFGIQVSTYKNVLDMKL